MTRPTVEALHGAVGILDIDAVSYATAVGQAAAQRLAHAMGLEGTCWFNGDYGLPASDDVEQAVQMLGAYTCTRTDVPLAEQLYRKAHEMELHALDVNGFDAQPVWLKAAYRVFAVSAFAAHHQIGLAQDQARDAEAKAKARAMAEAPVPVPAEDTAMEQHADAMELNEGFVAGAAPPAGAEAAAAPAFPADTPAEAAVEEAEAADDASSTTAEPKRRKK